MCEVNPFLNYYHVLVYLCVPSLVLKATRLARQFGGSAFFAKFHGWKCLQPEQELSGIPLGFGIVVIFHVVHCVDAIIHVIVARLNWGA